MKTKFFSVLIFLLIGVYSFAGETGVVVNLLESTKNAVTGKIIDESSNQPLEYVSVALYSTADSSLIAGTISDAEGNFMIDKVSFGSYFLKISCIGYSDQRTEKFSLTKSANRAECGTIAISPDSEDISEVIVSSEKSRIEYKIDKRIVNVDKELSAKGGTAVQALENTPSVQVDGQGNLTLRGSSDYIVLIDGKPSILKGSDALKQIPSNAIKQIEVITNPSAKYESDGQAGIINVIMKKEMLQGVNGNLSAAWGNTDKANANATLNLRKNKLNVFVGGDFANNTYRDQIDLNSKTILQSGIQNTSGILKEFSKNENLGLRGGFDWDINEKNMISLGGGISKQGYDSGSNAVNKIGIQGGNNRYYKSDIYMDVVGTVYNLNIDYIYKFNENSKLSIMNNLSTWSGRDENNLKEYYTDKDYNGENISSMNNFVKDNHNYTYRLNVDYNSKLFTGEFEAGAQFRIEPRFEDFTFNLFDAQNNTWAENDSFSYVLNYDNTIYSGYATYSDKIWGIGYKIGLRSEYFMRSIDIDTENAPIEYNKFMFYPSVHLSREFNEKNQMQVSYSRRINRPQPWVLNNTPRYLDTRNIFKGSPYLIPEFTDAYELNYRGIHNKVTYYVQTYFRNTTNSLTAVRIMDEGGVMYHQLANAKSQQSFGAELGGDIKPFDWWQMNTNVNVFNYKMTSSISSVDKVQQIVSWNARLVNNFNLKWGTRIQATAFYQAPNVDAMGKVSGFFVTNLAVSQPFFKGKLNLSISGQNLTPIAYTYSVKTDQFDNNYNISIEGPTVMFNLTYNFNNFQNKQRGRADDLDFKGGGGF